MTMRLERALDLISEVPDFPEPGVRYRDVTPLLADPDGFAAVTEALAAEIPDDVELAAGIEARGFVFAASIDQARGLGMLALRKPGKLPKVAAEVSYQLEYGSARLELPADTVRPGARIALVDDVLATGGTLSAAGRLIESVGATVASVSVVLELAELDGRLGLTDRKVHALRTS